MPPDDVLFTDVRRITDVCDLPLLVDVDTSASAPSASNVARTVKSMIKFGAAAYRGPGQRQRCGHRPNKEIVSQQEMVDQGRRRCPQRRLLRDHGAHRRAVAVEGLQAAIDRACACVEAGADMIFPEAMTELAMAKEFAVKAPVLANITEFGATRLFTTDELASGPTCALALYLLSAFPRHEQGENAPYCAIRRDGTCRRT